MAEQGTSEPGRAARDPASAELATKGPAADWGSALRRATGLRIKGIPPADLESARRWREEHERREAERLRLERDDPRFVVTMVHGTFARHATWVEAESDFGLELRSRLQPAQIEPFRWSGANDVWARERASHDLQVHLRERLDTFPDARHVIVTHSHGGNVVLGALSDPDLADRIDGVVTLATPFLSARTAEPEIILKENDALYAALFSGVGTFALGSALGHGRQWWWVGLLVFAAVLVLLGLATMLARRMKAFAGKVSRAMPDTRLEPARLAVIRTATDEAAGTLSGARVAGVLIGILWTLASSPVSRTLRRVLETVDYGGLRQWQAQLQAWADDKWAGEERTASWQPSSSLTPPGQSLTRAGASTLVATLPVLVLTLLDNPSPAMRWLGFAVAVAYGVPAVLALLLAVVSLPFGVLVAIGVLPCGWTLPLAGPFLDITVEPTPPGTWSVTQLRADARGGGLSHAKAHDDPEVHAVAGDFMLSRAAAATRASDEDDG